MLVLFEPDYRGHRAVFLGILLRHLRERGVRATVATTSDAIASSEFELQEIPLLLGKDTSVFALGALPPGRDVEYRRWLLACLRRVYAAHPEARVVVLEGEPMLTFGWKLPLSDLMRTTILVIRRPVLLGTTIRSTTASWAKASTIAIASRRRADIVLLSASAPAGETVPRKRIREAPDPVAFIGSAESSRAYADAHGLTRERTWYGVFGNVVRRKNLDLVAAALGKVAHPDGAGLLVAGRISDEERARCQSALSAFEALGGRVVFDNRLLPDSDLDAAIGAVDAAVFAQTGDSPSNIYGKSCAAGTPVVCSGSKILRRTIRKEESGLWTTLNPRRMARAYDEIVTTFERKPMQMASASEFAAALLESVASEPRGVAD